MTDPAHLDALRGDSLTWEVAFYLDEDGTPWADVEGYSPVCQVRTRASAPPVAATPALTYAGHVVTFSLTAEVMAGLTPRTYEWDVEFTDSTLGPARGTFTWPGPGSERNTLTVGADVTRVAS